MKLALLVGKGLLCLYDKQNTTWLLVDTEFLFSAAPRVPLFCSYHILTSSVIYY